MSTFRLQIVTPEGCAFDGQAEALRLPTTEGYVSIRANHIDYIAALSIGLVTVTVDGTEKNAASSGGFLTVEKGEVRLIATTFEYAEDIDVARAEAAKEKAQELLAQAKEAKDIELAKAKLSRALNRLKIAK